jgi:hypothetical protein
MAPIFVLGNHRSGTTWLYQLLAATGRVDYLPTYQVPDDAGRDDQAARCAMAARLRDTGLERRQMDAVPIGPTMPEEYYLVLRNAGYNGRLTRRSLPAFERMCARLRGASSQHRPLVLKNPWDYPGFPLIRELVPGARFIFIHRHPVRVLDSALRAARALSASRDPYYAMLVPAYDAMWPRSPLLYLTRLLCATRADFGVRALTAMVAYANGRYVRHVGRLAASEYVSIRYEDLCEHPAATMAEILRFCGVNARDTIGAVQPRPRNTDLLPEVRRWRPVIEGVHRRYMAMHGYPAA